MDEKRLYVYATDEVEGSSPMWWERLWMGESPVEGGVGSAADTWCGIT